MNGSCQFSIFLFWLFAPVVRIWTLSQQLSVNLFVYSTAPEAITSRNDSLMDRKIMAYLQAKYISFHTEITFRFLGKNFIHTNHISFSLFMRGTAFNCKITDLEKCLDFHIGINLRLFSLQKMYRAVSTFFTKKINFEKEETADKRQRPISEKREVKKKK